MSDTLDDLTEFDFINPSRVDAVSVPANGIGFLVFKSADPEELIKEFVDGLCGVSGCDVCHGRYQALKETEGFVEKARLKSKERHALSDSDFAFPKERKDPLNDEGHVRAAMGRFNQTEGVTPEERKAAAHKIIARAKALGIDVSEDSDVAQAAKEVSTAESESQTHEDPMAPEPSSPPVDATDAQGADGAPKDVSFPHPPEGDGKGDTAPDKDLHESEAESQTREDPATKSEEDMTGDHQEDKDVDPSAEESQTREMEKADADSKPGSPAWEHKDVALGERAEALTNELKEVVQTFTEREKAEGGVTAKQAHVLSGVKQLLDNPALIRKVAQMSMSAAEVLTKLGDDDARRAEKDAKKAEKKAFDKAVRKEAKKLAKSDKTAEDADASKAAEVDPSKMSKKDLAKQVAQLSGDLAKMSAEDGKRIPVNASGVIAMTRGQIEQQGADNVLKMFDDRIEAARAAHESATTPMLKEKAWRDYQLAQRQRLLAKMVAQESTGDPNTVRKGSKYGPDFTPLFKEGSTYTIGDDEGLGFTNDSRRPR